MQTIKKQITLFEDTIFLLLILYKIIIKIIFKECKIANNILILNCGNTVATIWIFMFYAVKLKLNYTYILVKLTCMIELKNNYNVITTIPKKYYKTKMWVPLKLQIKMEYDFFHS